MNRNLAILIVGAGPVFGLLGGAACRADEVFPVVHNEPIAVRVLNGKDGHPQPQTHVVLTAGYDRRDLKQRLWREEALTDAAGMVQLSSALRNLPLLQVEVLNRPGCAPGADSAVLSVERIRGSGLTSANRCGSAVVENAPGVFTVFVKGKKGVSSAASLAGSQGSVSMTPTPVTGSVIVQRAVAATSSASHFRALSFDDSAETIASESEAPAPNAHIHESAKIAVHGRASTSGDENDAVSQPNSALEPPIGSSGMAAPQSVQRGSRAPVSVPPGKQPHGSAPLNSSGTGYVPTASSAPGSKSPPTAKAAAGHDDQGAGVVKASLSTAAHPSKRTSGHASASAAAPLHASTSRSTPGIRQVSAASVRPKKAQLDLPANTARPALNERTLQQNGAPTVEPQHISAPSSAQVHGSASAAVRAASGAVPASATQTQTAHPPLLDPKPSSIPEPTLAPVHFRVHEPAPALAPVRVPEQMTDDEDLNSLCEPE